MKGKRLHHGCNSSYYRIVKCSWAKKKSTLCGSLECTNNYLQWDLNWEALQIFSLACFSRKQKLHTLCFEAILFHNSGVTKGQHWHNSEEITPALTLKKTRGGGISVKRYQGWLANFLFVFRRGEIVNKVVCSPVLLCLFSEAANFQNGCYILIPCLKLQLEKLKQLSKNWNKSFTPCLRI